MKESDQDLTLIDERYALAIDIGCGLLFLLALYALGLARGHHAPAWVSVGLFVYLSRRLYRRFPGRSVPIQILCAALLAGVLCALVWTSAFFGEMVFAPVAEREGITDYDRDILVELLSRHAGAMANHPQFFRIPLLTGVVGLTCGAAVSVIRYFLRSMFSWQDPA